MAELDDLIDSLSDGPSAPAQANRSSSVAPAVPQPKALGGLKRRLAVLKVCIVTSTYMCYTI